MKMRPTVNSDKSNTPDRFTHVNWYTDNTSEYHKKQSAGSKNVQTKYKTHSSPNDALSSIHASTAPLNEHIDNRKQHINNAANHRHEKSEETKYEDKSTETHDIDSLRRHQSAVINENSYDSHICCMTFKKKKCPELNMKKPKRLFERVIKKTKESKKLDESAATVSNTPQHRESIRCQSDSTKSKKSHKQDAAMEVTDKVSEKVRKEKKERREERKREKEEEKRQESKEKKEKELDEKDEKERKLKKEKKERERHERRERRKREEEISYPVDMHMMTEKDLVRDHVPKKPPPDYTKTCCYLCAQNTLAIAGASSKPEQFDKSVQVLDYKLVAGTPTLDKRCSPILLVRTVQSSVKVKTRETSTLCPGTSARREEEKPRTKRKKFRIFPRLTWTKCPAGGNAACETDKPTRRDNAEKREPKNERCCREKGHKDKGI